MEIFHKKSTDGGVSWTSPKKVSGGISPASCSPTIAVDSSGNLHVVWSEDLAFYAYLFYARSTDGGVTWSKARTFCMGPGNSRGPDIAVDSLDNLHVVWMLNMTEETYEIYYRKITNGGTTWSGISRITWTSGDSYNPVIAIDSSDILHVVWSDYTPGAGEVYYKKSTNGGVTWSTSKRLTWNSGNSGGSDIAIDSSDDLHMAWADDTPGNYEIYYRKSTNGGVTWSSSKRLTWNSGGSGGSDIAIDSSDDLHMVCIDDMPGNYEIYCQKSTNGGVTWSTSKRLTWNLGDSYGLATAMDPSDNLHVVWQDGTPGNWEIYYKKFIK
jgi:hypothetical protein